MKPKLLEALVLFLLRIDLRKCRFAYLRFITEKMFFFLFLTLGLSISYTVCLLLFLNQGNAKTVFFLSNWICVCLYVRERILKNVDL